MKRNDSNMLLLMSVSVIWCLIGWVLHSWLVQPAISNRPTEINLIEKVYERIFDDYYWADNTSSAPQQLSYAAIRAMLAQTHDPYAKLFTPPASVTYALDMSGKVGVPDFRIDIVDKKIVIVKITPDTPTERAGIKVGDIILGVDGIMFDATTSGDEASMFLRGTISTTAQITVQRGQQLLEFPVVRTPLTIFTTQMISHEIGYIGQSLFPVDSEIEMRQYLQPLLDQGVQALIWDLRESGGGSLQATQTIVNYFVAQGVLYMAEFKDGKRQEFLANAEYKLTDLPLVVLIDQKTYSSSEVAALALQEHDRALLIGTTTQGKGTIQETTALDEQHLLRLTIARWLSPSGKSIQGRGVTPDIEMVDDPATATDEVLGFAARYISQKLLEK